MKLRSFHTGFYFFLLLFAAPLAAQLTPVEVSVRLFQPSVYPEDLSLPGAAAVFVTLTDMDRASFSGYLRLTLSNTSGQQLTTPLVAETRVDLTPFNTVTFTGPSLERFVRLLGADAGAMESNGLVLAEGDIELCAEFFDLDFPFEDPVSNPELNCAFGFAELHEPPTPLLPVGEEVAIDPLLDVVNFTWAPNYFGGPVINYLTVWDVPREWAGVTPDIIMTSLEPIRQPLRVNALNSLSKVWYNSDADLIPGHRYLYRIQATDPTGRTRFRNKGYSRPVFFDYVSPTPFVDRLCYEPEGLTLNGKDGDYELFWTGYPLDSVDHSVTVLTLPERGFVQRAELLSTPDFPARRPENGGPLARFNYDISSNLDTTDGRAYLVTLCSVCPATGEEFCEEIILGTPREAGSDDGPDPTDSTLVCGLYPPPALTITDLTATTATVGWELPDDFGGSFVLRWAAPKSSGIPDDSTALAGDVRSYAPITLVGNTEYTVTLCVVCPDGARACYSEQMVTPNYDCPTADDILAGVTVTALPPDGIVATWSSAFPGSNPNGWWAYLNDGGGGPAPEKNNASANSPAPATAPTDITFTTLNPDSSYVVTICYACAEGAPVCADFDVTLGGCADLDLDLTVARAGFDQVDFTWDATGEDDYAMAYAKVGSGPADDFFEVNAGAHTLSGLYPLTTYDVVLRAPCEGTMFYDTIQVTTTNMGCSDAGEFSYEYECGAPGGLDSLDRGTRVTNLTPGDTIWAGDFLVEVGEADADGDQFGGYGFVKVPLLSGAKLKLEFREVEVNENCRMVAGEMAVVSPIRSALERLQELVAGFTDLLDDIDNVLGQVSEALGAVQDALNTLADSVENQDAINELLDAANAAIVQIPYLSEDLLNDLEDAEDCIRQATQNQDQTALDACTDRYEAVLASIEEFTNELFNAPFRVDFAQAENQGKIYGYDVEKYPAIPDPYVTHTIAGEEYKVPWASTQLNGTAPGNKFVARRNGGGELTDVFFVDGEQETISGWNFNGGKTEATHPALEAPGDKETRHVFAALPRDTAGGKPPVYLAGQISIVSYKVEEVTVHLVPVNNATISADQAFLQQRLNEIYNPAVVDVTVVVEPTLSAPEFSGTLSDIQNHTLSNYTPEMLGLRRLVKQQPYHTAGDYYLMVVENMEPAGREGFMPRKRHYGFLNGAVVNTPEETARVAAHELGHGAWHLQHPFHQFTGAQEGGTQTLMDYGEGDEVLRYQWGEVHDPVGNFTLFDDEEEGESVLCDAPPPSNAMLVAEGQIVRTTSGGFSPDMPYLEPPCSVDWTAHLGVEYSQDGIQLSTERQWVRSNYYKFLRPIQLFVSRADLLMNPFDDGILEMGAQNYFNYFTQNRVIHEDFWPQLFKRSNAAGAFPAILPYLTHLWLSRGNVSSVTGLWFNNDDSFHHYGNFTSYYSTLKFQSLLQSRTNAAQQVKFERVFEVNQNVTTENDGLMLLGGFVFGVGPEMYRFPVGHSTCKEILNNSPIVSYAIEEYRNKLNNRTLLQNTDEGWFVYRYKVSDEDWEKYNDLAWFIGEYHKIKTLLGSCTVVIGPSNISDMVEVHVFNSTNAYSGDLVKEVLNKLPNWLDPNLYVEPDYGERATQRGEVMQNGFNVLKIPFSNIGQHFMIGDVPVNFEQ